MVNVVLNGYSQEFYITSHILVSKTICFNL